ncbi:MAG TPA: 2OG-Fe(II) oxygenase [Arenibaculum sp.]|nr:2OG-Fe(II) oxygenase [Arenibaculum sp.]
MSAHAGIDWRAVEAGLDERGFAVLPGLLDARACADLAGLYDRDDAFRSTIVMQRHAFGRGEYRYFGYPLPPPVQALRASLYERLVPAANRWRAAPGRPDPFPGRLDAFLAQCHAGGQRRPTPLLLRYGPDDYNCLHQDLYGELAFPLQVAVLLNEPGRDFEGGEFLLVEQRPRAQSRGEVVPLGRGDGVVFAVDRRPVRGTKGVYGVTVRHGTSRVRSGRRHTLGIIFHDAA